MTDQPDWPDDDVYDMSWEAMQQLSVPEGLTPEQLHEFWAAIETHAYYERLAALSRLCGEDRDHYRENHLRKQMVVAFHLGEDSEKQADALRRWLGDL